jgi:hypothetical protein
MKRSNLSRSSPPWHILFPVFLSFLTFFFGPHFSLAQLNRTTSHRWSSSSWLQIRYITAAMALLLPLLLMAFKDHETARHKHKSNSKFSAQSVQGIYSLHNCLKLSNRRHAPNAIGRHCPPDLPSRTMPALSKRVTLCLSFHSATFVHKVSPDKVYADHTIHATVSLKLEFIARSCRRR